MTESTAVMDQAEQDRLTKETGRALVRSAGPGWSHIRAEYRSVGRHVEVDVLVTGADGQPHSVRPPAEAVDGLRRMRGGMYRPERGTWISAVYEIEPPGSFTVEFEPDAEPAWRRPPPPIGFIDELRFFPRADENIPEWLRMRAGLPPAVSPEIQAAHTPPQGIEAQSPDAAQAPPAARSDGGPGQGGPMNGNQQRQTGAARVNDQGGPQQPGEGTHQSGTADQPGGQRRRAPEQQSGATHTPPGGIPQGGPVGGRHRGEPSGGRRPMNGPGFSASPQGEQGQFSPPPPVFPAPTTNTPAPTFSTPTESAGSTAPGASAPVPTFTGGAHVANAAYPPPGTHAANLGFSAPTPQDEDADEGPQRPPPNTPEWDASRQSRPNPTRGRRNS
ncbi:MAG: hypothetical protein M3548_07580 [Actinomycetota bacterium]|nr:hypothetical protein [Actinomycetota bacterium]